MTRTGKSFDVRGLGNKIKGVLKSKGADLICFLDISHLPERMNRGFPVAILLGMILSPEFIRKVSDHPDYVQNMIKHRMTEEDEFNNKEKQTDRMADYLAGYLNENGYTSLSQSESALSNAGIYDETAKITPLPHKAIALIAGLGWIGRHDLLVTPDYGSALSIASVLTHAPLSVVRNEPENPKCGKCTICRDICPGQAIVGKDWNIMISRDELVDVNKCSTCLLCMVHCPWTQKYMKREITK